MDPGTELMVQQNRGTHFYKKKKTYMKTYMMINHLFQCFMWSNMYVSIVSFETMSRCTHSNDLILMH